MSIDCTGKLFSGRNMLRRDFWGWGMRTFVNCLSACHDRAKG